jgi:hypothetical protein
MGALQIAPPNDGILAIHNLLNNNDFRIAVLSAFKFYLLVDREYGLVEINQGFFQKSFHSFRNVLLKGKRSPLQPGYYFPLNGHLGLHLHH